MYAQSFRYCLPTLGMLLVSAALANAQTGDPRRKTEEEKPTSDASALSLLDQSAVAYRALESYRDQGRLVSSMVQNGKPVVQSMPVPIKMSRPNRIQFELGGDATIVSDGKAMLVSLSKSRQYASCPAPDDLTFETLKKSPLASMVFGGTGMHFMMFWNLMFAPDARTELLKPHQSIAKLGREVTLGGKTYKAVVLIYPGPDYRILIDPRTMLVGRIEMILAKNELQLLVPPDQDVKDVQVYWEPGKVSTEKLGDDAFKTVGPAGFTKVDGLSGLFPNLPETRDPAQDMLGRKIPELTLTMFDGRSETLKLTTSSLSGKIVVLSFFSTGCEPCMIHLNDLMELARKNEADYRRDVVFASLCIDPKPASQIEQRKYVEAWLKSRGFVARGVVPLYIGLDEGRIAEKVFHASIHPTVVLIDSKGVVQAVSQGLSSDGPGTYESQLKKLLSGVALHDPDKTTRK